MRRSSSPAGRRRRRRSVAGERRRPAASPTTTTTTIADDHDATTTRAAGRRSRRSPALAPSDPLDRARPALVVKIDNVDADGPARRPASTRPTSSIEERGRGRHHPARRRVPLDRRRRRSGPIRSARTTDIDIARAARPAAASPGRAPTTACRRACIRAARRSSTSATTPPPATTSATPAAAAPHNLFARRRPTPLRPRAGRGPRRRRRCSPTASRGRAAAAAGAARRRACDVDLRRRRRRRRSSYALGRRPSGWAPHPERHAPRRRRPACQVAPANVIVQFVDYAPPTSPTRPAPARPRPRPSATGEAWVFTDGQVIVRAAGSEPPLDAVTDATPTPTASRSRSPRARRGSSCPQPGGADPPRAEAAEAGFGGSEAGPAVRSRLDMADAAASTARPTTPARSGSSGAWPRC